MQISSRRRSCWLNSAFPASADPVHAIEPAKAPTLDAHLLALFVLYEDLRLEIEGLRALDLPGLDGTSIWVRRLYFHRRSFATIREVWEVVKSIDKNSSLCALLLKKIQDKDPNVRTAWNRMVEHFGRTSEKLGRVRNDIGGHLSPNIVQWVMQQEAWAHEVGSAEVSLKGGLRLEFVWLVGAIATIRQMSPKAYREQLEELFKDYLTPSCEVLTAFVKAAFGELYWDKMGK